MTLLLCVILAAMELTISLFPDCRVVSGICRLNLTVDWILERVPGGRVLDIGCFSALYSGLLKQHSPERYVVGCDLDLNGLQKAKRLLDDTVRADARHLPFALNSFDDAISVEVIEHLSKQDGERLTEEARRVSRRVTVTTPNGWQGNGPEYLFADHRLMQHQSAWTVADFTKLGATQIRGTGWKLPFKVLRHFLWFIPYWIPRFGNNIIAVFTQAQAEEIISFTL